MTRICAAIALTLAVTMAGAPSAMATGTIECEAMDGGDAYASILTTRAGSHMFMPLRGLFGAGDRHFASETLPGAPPAEPIVLAHAYGDARTIIAEYTTTDIERPVVSLRLSSAATDEAEAIAGVLLIEGVGVWAVACEAG